MTQSGPNRDAERTAGGRTPAAAGGSPDNSTPPGLRGAFVLLAFMAFGDPALAADAFSTDWAMSPKSQARLIAADGRLGGFEIKLAPGAITYWRDPGDSGVPPTFDFSGSINVAKVEPILPAPKRLKESDGGVAFGYERGVVIPLRIEPADPSKPVTLAMHVNYAVCEKICLPAAARLRLTMPQVGGSPYAGAVEAALSAAPTPIAPADFGDLAVDGGDGWLFCPKHDGEKARDLFVESPPGWWVAAAPEPDERCFRLLLREKPKDGSFPVSLRLTLTGGAHSVEATLAAPAPEE